MKPICVLITPTGEEYFDAYGPMTKDRNKATRFASSFAAINAAMARLGIWNTAFWESEREHERRAAKEYAGWKYRVEEVPNN